MPVVEETNLIAILAIREKMIKNVIPRATLCYNQQNIVNK